MSEVAGTMSIQEGVKYLERPMVGCGILLGGVAGVEPAGVLILGAGTVGASAARVTLMDVNLDRLRMRSGRLTNPAVAAAFPDLPAAEA